MELKKSLKVIYIVLGTLLLIRGGLFVGGYSGNFARQEFSDGSAKLVHDDFELIFPDEIVSCKEGICEHEFKIIANKEVMVNYGSLKFEFKTKSGKDIKYKLYVGEMKNGIHKEKVKIKNETLCPEPITPGSSVSEDCLISFQHEQGIICDRIEGEYCIQDLEMEEEVVGEYIDWGILISEVFTGEKLFKVVFPLEEKKLKYDVIFNYGGKQNRLDPSASSFTWNTLVNPYFAINDKSKKCASAGGTYGHEMFANDTSVNNSFYLVFYNTYFPNDITLDVTRVLNGTKVDYVVEYLSGEKNSLTSNGVWKGLNLTWNTCGNFSSVGTCYFNFTVPIIPSPFGRNNYQNHYVNGSDKASDLLVNCPTSYYGFPIRFRVINFTSFNNTPVVKTMKGGENTLRINCPASDPCDFDDAHWYMSTYHPEEIATENGNLYEFGFNVYNSGQFNTSNEIVYVGNWNSYAPLRGYGSFTCGELLFNEKAYKGSSIFGNSLTVYTQGWGWNPSTRHYDCTFKKLEYNSTTGSATGKTYNYLSGKSIGSKYIGSPGIGAAGNNYLWADLTAYSDDGITNIMTSEIDETRNINIFASSVGTAFYLYNGNVKFKEPKVREISSTGQYYNIYQTTVNPVFQFIDLSPPSPKQGVSSKKAVYRTGYSLGQSGINVFFWDDSASVYYNMTDGCNNQFCNLTNDTTPEAGDYLLFARFSSVNANCWTMMGNKFYFNLTRINDADTYWETLSYGVWKDIDKTRWSYDLTRTNYTDEKTPALTHSNYSYTYFGLTGHQTSNLADVGTYGCYYRLVWNGTASNPIEGKVTTPSSYQAGISNWKLRESYSLSVKVFDEGFENMNGVTITLYNDKNSVVFQEETGLVDASAHTDFYINGVSDGDWVELDRQPEEGMALDFVVSSFSITGVYPHAEINGEDDIGISVKEIMNIDEEGTFTTANKYRNITNVSINDFSSDLEINMNGRIYNQIVPARELFFDPVLGDNTYGIFDEDVTPHKLVLSKTGYENKNITININQPISAFVTMNPPGIGGGGGQGGALYIGDGVAVG